MFTRLGRAVVRHPVRVLVLWLVVIAGLIVGGGAILGPDGTGAVTDTKQTDFLPSRYESVQAAKIADRAFGGQDAGTALLVFHRADGGPLTGDDVRTAGTVVDRLAAAKVRGVKTIATSPDSVSPNRKIQIAQVALDRDSGDPRSTQAVTDLRDRTRTLVEGTDLRAGYTGDAAAAKDSEGVDQLVQYGMIIVIFTLMLLLFRSPLLAIINVALIAAVGQGVVMALAVAAKVGHFGLDSDVTGLLPVVLFGVGTDYVVFLLFRYRERLRAGDDKRTAMATALGRVGEAVSASALAVVVSFGAMLLSAFGSFRVLGPSLAFAVLAMLVAGLTLVPAVFVLLGRALFFPSRSWRREPRRTGVSGWLGHRTARSPRAVLVTGLLLLGVLSVAALGYKPSYAVNSVPPNTESSRTLDVLETGFPTGALNPTNVYLTGPAVTEQVATRYADTLRQAPIVGGIGQVTVRNGTAEIDVLLNADPLGKKAIDGVRHQLRPVAHRNAPPGTRVAVGGPTSTMVDVSKAVGGDMARIFPAAGLLIGLILLFMLRGLLAPVYLLGAVVLGFCATLGASVAVFQWAGGKAGLEFQLPLVVYLFVASLGTDYNILMVSRIREELREGQPPRQAAAHALRRTGPTIAAAGVILAGSFGALTLSPDLSQIGFAVAIGVLISAFVLSWLLVPALSALAGRSAFWPSRVAPPRHAADWSPSPQYSSR
jgi:RND superfamily putative drug exporter